MILSRLEEKDMYGYEMIDTLKGKLNNVFELKAGTLYPLLHSMEEKGWLTVYEQLTSQIRCKKMCPVIAREMDQIHRPKMPWKAILVIALMEILSGIFAAFFLKQSASEGDTRACS